MRNSSKLRILLFVVLVVAIAVTLASLIRIQHKKAQALPVVATIGNNSPAVNMSAKTTGSSSPVIQAAPGATVNANINYGISEETMRKLLIDEDNNSRTELIEKYPQGYVLLGLANGKIVYEPRIKNFQLLADWDNTTLTIDSKTGIATLFIPKLDFSFPSGQLMTLNDMTFFYQYVEHQQWENHIIRMPPMPRIFAEVEDRNNGVFLIGFK